MLTAAYKYGIIVAEQNLDGVFEMKKFFAVILALAMVLGLASCASEPSNSAEPSDEFGTEPSGDIALPEIADGEVMVRVYLADAELLCEKTTAYTDGMTAFDAFKTVCEGENIEYASKNGGYGTYVSAVAGLAEGADGGWSGWTYKVNGEMPMDGIGDHTLSGGDLVSVMYTRDFEDITDLY